MHQTKNRKQETAPQAFGRNAEKAIETMKAIQEAILRNDCRQSTWPMVGDLAYVNELLDQVKEFYVK
jgi:CHAD domain-containing protein